MFKQKETEHLFNADKIKINDYEIYSVVSDYAHTYNRQLVNKVSAFNVYVDKENEILHIFDPLGEGYLKQARSIVNTVSKQFIDELRKALKIKRAKYDVYIYMHPKSELDITPFKSAYSYNADDFMGIEETKVFDYFINLGNEKSPFIF